MLVHTHVQLLLEEVGVGVVRVLPLAHLSMQYKTEADKKGFCFICHIAAYEFDRRADVSGLRSRMHACTYSMLPFSADSTCALTHTYINLIDLLSLCSCSNLQPM